MAPDTAACAFSRSCCSRTAILSCIAQPCFWEATGGGEGGDGTDSTHLTWSPGSGLTHAMLAGAGKPRELESSIWQSSQSPARKALVGEALLTLHAATSAVRSAFCVHRASTCSAPHTPEGSAGEARWQAVPSSRQVTKQVVFWCRGVPECLSPRAGSLGLSARPC